jgi:hypothetical protein
VGQSQVDGIGVEGEHRIEPHQGGITTISPFI